MNYYLISYKAMIDLTHRQYASTEAEAIEKFKEYFKPEDNLSIRSVEFLEPAKV